MKKRNNAFRVVNKVKQLLLDNNLLQPNQSLIVAISGGQDSIFLFILIFLIKKQWKINFSILYCNHLWDEKCLYSYNHVLKLAYCFQIVIFYSIPPFILSSEEESRFWRSKNYSRFNQFLKSSTILSGHTLTDQIETFFFNTIRGSSIQASYSIKLKKNFLKNKKSSFFFSDSELKNILIIKKQKSKKNSLYYENKVSFKYNKKLVNVYFFEKKTFYIIPKKSFSIFVIRPLLSVTRFDIKKICMNWDLPIFPDSSNQKLQYSRNRVRKQILPCLRFFFNRKLDLNLYRYIEICSEEEITLENVFNKILNQVLNENEIAFFFNLSLFCSLPLSIQRKIFLFFLKEKLKKKYNFLKINDIVMFINNRVYKNQGKIFNKKETNFFYYVVFPEFGTIFISKNFFMFLK